MKLRRFAHDEGHPPDYGNCGHGSLVASRAMLDMWCTSSEKRLRDHYAGLIAVNLGLALQGRFDRDAPPHSVLSEQARAAAVYNFNVAVQRGIVLQ